MAVSEPFPTVSNATSGDPFPREVDPRSSTSRIDATPPQETWSLRRQFIVPLGATILLVALAVSLITWWAANDAEDRWAADKLSTVFEQLKRASYPLTKNVIDQIKSYSGVDAILVPREGLLPVSTLSAADLSQLEKSGLESLATQGSLSIGDRSYHYRKHNASVDFRDSELRALVLLVHRPRDLGFWHAPVWAPIASGLVSVLAMIIVTTAIGSRMVRRIEGLEAQVKRIALGQYDIAEPKGPEDAIRRLSVSINTMSSQLEKAHDWIARTERSRLITMIAGGMAHELRNALTGASLLVQSCLRSYPEHPPQELIMAENQLQRAADSVRRLLASDPSIELVDEPDMTASTMTQAMQDCVATYARHQQVELVWETDPQLQEVWVPQGAAVTGALVNLLMNAIEAAGRGGHVCCELAAKNLSRDSVHLRNDEVHVDLCWRIIDSGPGPDPSVAHSMMEPFVTSKQEGIGLGLPMAARVAQRCHGSLTWRREGAHTVFELVIPSQARQGSFV
ncbi:MAG: HAMP domain-containing histidine kinase [Pirellula sp.]|jgi:nitrogen-specific signal transduction histidine kinase|nr:HAMP domain-containing histidine kinase [Pirellula sp.]